MLIDLMREVDRCERDVVFFADEAGSWQVGVLWDRVLPAWFRSLSPTTEAYAWAETVVDARRDFASYQMDEILEAAREAGTAEQRKALTEHHGRDRSGRQRLVHVHGNDTLGCVVDAQRSFSSDAPLRLCKFIRCIDSGATTSFSCPSGTVSATSPGGRDGCCGSSGFEIDDVDCSGTLDEDTEVFIRIDRENGTGCTSYSLSYHY